MRAALSVASAPLLLFSACTTMQPTPVSVTDEVSQRVTQQVTASVHGFFDGWSRVTCENGDAVANYFLDNTIFVEEHEVVTVPFKDGREGIKVHACQWTKHDGGVDSVRVDVFSPSAASAAWTYHDIITLKTGKVRRKQGAALQTWVNRGSGWKIAATKYSEKLLSEQ